MTDQTTKASGAVMFTDSLTFVGRHRSAAVFIDHQRGKGIDGEWRTIIDQIRSFQAFVDDWDGSGSSVPPRDVVQAARRLASDFMRCSHLPPARVVAGVNGTISLEYPGHPFIEIEVIAADEARVYEDGRRKYTIAI